MTRKATSIPPVTAAIASAVSTSTLVNGPISAVLASRVQYAESNARCDGGGVAAAILATTGLDECATRTCRHMRLCLLDVHRRGGAAATKAVACTMSLQCCCGKAGWWVGRWRSKEMRGHVYAKRSMFIKALIGLERKNGRSQIRGCDCTWRRSAKRGERGWTSRYLCAEISEEYTTHGAPEISRVVHGGRNTMTRLVGVRAVCDRCSAARAVVFCVVHRTVTCTSCDVATHPTGDGTVSSHQRVDLGGAVTALPFCEKCDNAPATSYCESEGVTLCGACDDVVHETCNSHDRRLITAALAQRTVSFTGAPPPGSAALVKPGTAAPVVKQRRRGSMWSPVKRRLRREVCNTGAEERRGRYATAPVRLSPAPPPPTTTPVAPTAHSNVAPMTQDGTLAFMQAMNLMTNREPLEYYDGGALEPYFGADVLAPPSASPPPSTSPFLLDTTRRSSSIFTNLGSLPPRQAIHDSVAAAAAAAATAAGELFLLSATSSDQHNSASSDALSPQPPDAAGLAAAATLAAESTVAAIGQRLKPTPEPPPERTNDDFTDLDIARDGFNMFGALDLAPFEPPYASASAVAGFPLDDNPDG